MPVHKTATLYLPHEERKRTTPEEESDTDDDGGNDEIEGDVESELYQLSEETGAFIETAFKSKLDNTTRKMWATKFGVPNSWWLKCPKLDPVISITIPLAACRADRSASRLQQFWLDAVSPKVHVLEKADEVNLPTKADMVIQTSLQLMGNANQHNSNARRNALLTLC